MKLIKQSHEIEYITPEPLKVIEAAARNCYQSQDKIEEGSAEKLVQKLIKKGHDAMLEFASMRVKFITSRSVLTELERHRIASFAVLSQRYVAYKDNVPFIIPVWCENMIEGEIKNINEYYYTDYDYLSPEEQTLVLDFHQIESFYKIWLKKGWTPQQAREVLPGATKTEIILYTNFRSWRNIFKLRTAYGAHPQIRALMLNLLKEVKKEIPLIFDDIKV